MNTILDWIDQRSGLVGWWRRYCGHVVPGRAGWLKVWPSTILFTFCVQAITGFVLWTYYSPSDQSAWESVYFLQHEVAGAWLLRAVHHYSAQVLLVLIGIYVVQMILSGRYRRPRELVFWVAVLLGLLSLGLVLTGDLLPWDQNSYASTQVRVNFLKLLPGVGQGLYKIAIGGPGPAFGHLTLPRFLALHVGLFAGLFLVLLVLHVIVARRADVAEAATAGRTTAWWPDQASLGAVGCLVVLVVIMLLGLQHGVSPEGRGVALGSPADLDPANKYAAARPEWAFRGLYEFSHLFPGELALVPIFIVPGLLVCLVLAMPFVGRSRAGHVFNVALTAVVLVGTAALSLRSLAEDAADPEHQAAIAAEQERADRVVWLARFRHGIPATGGLSLLQDDPKTQGPLLFKTHCASCHNYVGPKSEQGNIEAEEASAPNLFGYACRRWIAGWFDPQTITGPDRFGNTKLKGDDMVGFVKSLYEGIEGEEVEDLREDLEKVAAALSAEAGLPSQAEMDARDSALIEEGRQLIRDDYGCTDCHRFHTKSSAGGGPDLGGYGSRAWTMAIISNPAQKRFYGQRNDRMPAYAESADDPSKNILSRKQIELLSDWLRGQWPD
jgi:ubiquinol-cytochrome c reductase cytochrome b subunit